MQRFFQIRKVLVALVLLWAALYLPVNLLSGSLSFFAPLSMCQIPFLPIFYGVNFGYVLYVLAVLFALVSCVLSLCERFCEKLWPLVAPFALLVVDLFGQISSFQALSFELYEEGRLEAYYYFNGVRPPEPWFFLVAIAADLLWFALLAAFPLAARIRKKKAPNADSTEEDDSVGIVTDNWSEIFSETKKAQDFAPSVDEAYKTECEKK